MVTKRHSINNSYERALTSIHVVNVLQGSYLHATYKDA